MSSLTKKQVHVITKLYRYPVAGWQIGEDYRNWWTKFKIHPQTINSLFERELVFWGPLNDIEVDIEKMAELGFELNEEKRQFEKV